MIHWQFGIDVRSRGKLLPDLLNSQYLNLSLGGLCNFLHQTTGLFILIEVKTRIGSNETIIEEFLHLGPVDIDALHTEIPVKWLSVCTADDSDLRVRASLTVADLELLEQGEFDVRVVGAKKHCGREAEDSGAHNNKIER